MFGNNAEWDAYLLGRSSMGLSPGGPSCAGWYSPKQVEEIELSHKKNTAGVVAQREALLKALTELDPNHPLVNRENRLAVYDQGYDAYKEKK